MKLDESCILFFCLDMYLLGKRVFRGKISIALAVNGGFSTSTNGIHFPMCVVIVYHVEVPMPTPATLLINPQKYCQNEATFFKSIQIPKGNSEVVLILAMGTYVTLAFSGLDLHQNGCRQLSLASAYLLCRSHYDPIALPV